MRQVLAINLQAPLQPDFAGPCRGAEDEQRRVVRLGVERFATDREINQPQRTASNRHSAVDAAQGGGGPRFDRTVIDKQPLGKSVVPRKYQRRVSGLGHAVATSRSSVAAGDDAPTPGSLPTNLSPDLPAPSESKTPSKTTITNQAARPQRVELPWAPVATLLWAGAVEPRSGRWVSFEEPARSRGTLLRTGIVGSNAVREANFRFITLGTWRERLVIPREVADTKPGRAAFAHRPAAAGLVALLVSRSHPADPARGRPRVSDALLPRRPSHRGSRLQPGRPLPRRRRAGPSPRCMGIARPARQAWRTWVERRSAPRLITAFAVGSIALAGFAAQVDERMLELIDPASTDSPAGFHRRWRGESLRRRSEIYARAVCSTAARTSSTVTEAMMRLNSSSVPRMGRPS